MQCQQVRELLSAFYDDELPHDQAEEVSAHIAGCAECAAELETFHKLSDLTERLDDPRPPRHVWPRIAAQLSTNQAAGESSTARPRRSRRAMLLSVCVLLLIGLAWAVNSRWHEHQHHEMAENFSRFLDTFGQAPDAAVEDLVHIYSGRPIAIADAARELKYQPAVMNGLPDDYDLAQACLLKMPCCLCLEVCYHRKSGGMICVFEHDDAQPAWFGNRPASSKVCSGKPTRLVPVDGHLAATWPHDRRHITVIGAKDADEVARLVEHFERPRGL